MDEDIAIKSIIIGVSIFITLATITAVLSYYNVAKISVNKVGQGIELEENYRRDIETLLLKDIVNGSELKNILIYFKDDKRVNINILKYVAFKADGNVDIISLGDNYNEVNIVEKDNVKKNNFDNILKNIIPNQNYELIKNDNKYEFKIK